MPDTLRVAAVQFENASGDAAHNLDTIERLTQQAATAGAQAIAFHECSISGYSFARKLTHAQLDEVAEAVPDGAGTQRLIAIARAHRVFVLAGLFERDAAGRLYNTYVCVGPDGFIAAHRKLHPFIHPDLTPGDHYTVFELAGWRCGILTCYDNNVIENVRATALLGADVIFMPHVTMCTPSTRPGAGFVDPALWRNRARDAAALRAEFDGSKGRTWLMKWLPARAYDNGVYVVFANPIGMDDDQLKNGCSMILDPFGDVLAECRRLDDDFVVATLAREKLTAAGGHRYRQARRPDLYRGILGRAHASVQKVAWMQTPERD
jgi:predicted amidohydrolase